MIFMVHYSIEFIEREIQPDNIKVMQPPDIFGGYINFIINQEKGWIGIKMRNYD